MIQTFAGVLLLVLISTFATRPTVTPGTSSTASPAAPDSIESKVATDSETADDFRASNLDFAYYVLALSWSPSHCAGNEGQGEDDDLQCRSGRPYGFVLHGLWPQNEQAHVPDCSRRWRGEIPDAVMTRMLEISPSRILVHHEWRKHGLCSGLSLEDYFSAAERAYRSIVFPRMFVAPQQALFTTPDQVKMQFAEANPAWPRQGILVTCRRNDLGEVRLCLDKELRPRACSSEVMKRHCGSRRVRMLAVRGEWPRQVR